MKASLYIGALIALFAATLSPVRADDYTMPAVGAEQILKKIDAAAGAFAPGSYRTTIERIGHGTVQNVVTLRHGRDYKTVRTMDSFVSAWGRFDGQDWSMDENGVVFAQKHAEELTAVTDRIDSSKYTRVLGISTQTGCLDVDVNAPHSEHTIRCYDPQTYLLRQTTTWSKDLHKHVAAFSDYRASYGAMVPFARRYSDGRPENDTTETVTSIEKLAAIPDLAVPRSKPMFALAGAPLTLPATFDPAGHIIVRVNVGDRGLDFALDTGAGAIVLDSGVARELGVRSVGRFGSTIGGDFQSSWGRLAQMSVGSVTMRGVALYLSPISYITQSGKEVGLLGRDFLASSVVEIDYKHKVVKLWPRDTFDGAAGGLSPVTADFSSDTPAIKASFENVQGKFLFDTGAEFSMLYRPYLESLPERVAGEGSMTGEFVGGPVQLRPFHVHDLSLGPVLFRNADLWVPLSSTAEFGDYDGIIGRDIMSYYRIFLDYQNAKLYLLSNP